MYIRPGKILDAITDRRVISDICLLTIIAAAFTLTRRVRFTSAETNDLTSVVSAILFGTPFYLFLLLLVTDRFPDSRFTHWLNSVTSIRLLAPICLTGMLIAWILYGFNLPYVTGSWASDAMLLAGIMLIVSRLRGRMANLHAFMFAIGIMGIWTGVWEVPYQTMLRLKYDVVQIGMHETLIRIAWEWIIEVLTAGYGAVLVGMLNRRYRVVRITPVFWIMLGLCVGAIVLWAVTGYWVDDYYDWNLDKWIRTPEFNVFALFLAKVSKTFFALALISLIWRQQGGKSFNRNPNLQRGT